MVCLINIIVIENKCSNKVCFGRGFRKLDPSISAVGFNPAVREKEIAVEIDPVSKFCIETVGEGDDKCYRYRSDISMLLHAKDTANKIGVEGLRYLSDQARISEGDCKWRDLTVSKSN